MISHKMSIYYCCINWIHIFFIYSHQFNQNNKMQYSNCIIKLRIRTKSYLKTQVQQNFDNSKFYNSKIPIRLEFSSFPSALLWENPNIISLWLELFSPRLNTLFYLCNSNSEKLDLFDKLKFTSFTIKFHHRCL